MKFIANFYLQNDRKTGFIAKSTNRNTEKNCHFWLKNASCTCGINIPEFEFYLYSYYTL